jgi:DNA polymerase/3'-5' exonuclease PolX
MQEDQAIAEIREVRRQISEECGHDPRKLVTYYKELQLRHKERLLAAEEGKEEVAESVR